LILDPWYLIQFPKRKKEKGINRILIFNLHTDIVLNKRNHRKHKPELMPLRKHMSVHALLIIVKPEIIKHQVILHRINIEDEDIQIPIICSTGLFSCIHRCN
jgi:hypothetical protein